MKEVFNTLYHKDVSNYTQDKQGLSYLSWADAWAEVQKEYPNASYEIQRFENNLPYVFDEKTGYMVFTSVTIEGQTHEMWLPVMDFRNNAMKGEPYQVKTRKGSNTVASATMFDINKTIMRCLTKNLAMFGLGLYIFAGEDLPEEQPAKQITPDQVKSLESVIKHIAELIGQPKDKAQATLLNHQNLPNNLKELDDNQYGSFLQYLNKLKTTYEEKAKEEKQEDNEEQEVEQDDETEQEGLFEGNTTTPKE